MQINSITSYDLINFKRTFIVICVVAGLCLLSINYDLSVVGMSINDPILLGKLALIFIPFIIFFALKKQVFKSFPYFWLFLPYALYGMYCTIFIMYSYVLVYFQVMVAVLLIFKMDKTELNSIIFSYMFFNLIGVVFMKSNLIPSVALELQFIFGISTFIYSLVLYYYKNFIVVDDYNSFKQSHLFSNMGKVIGFMCDEIGVPLSKIDNKDLSEKTQKHITEIKLISDLSNFFTGNLEKRDINKTDENIKSLIEELLGDNEQVLNYFNIAVSIEGEANVECSKPHLKLSLKNLIKNSIEELIKEDCTNKYLNIYIDNSSIKIANSLAKNTSHDTSKLMLPFVSTKDNSDNKGLGLFLVKELLRINRSKLFITIKKNEFISIINFGNS